MKIIKKGKVKEPETKKTCHKCKTVFTFTNKDIKPDFRDGNYVECPVCKTSIATD